MTDSASALAGLGVTWDDEGRPDGFQIGKSAALLDWQHKREEREFAERAERMLTTERVQCQAVRCCLPLAVERREPPRCQERATRYKGGRFVCWVHAATARELDFEDGRGVPRWGRGARSVNDRQRGRRAIDGVVLSGGKDSTNAR